MTNEYDEEIHSIPPIDDNSSVEMYSFIRIEMKKSKTKVNHMIEK